MRSLVLALIVFCAGAAQAAITHVPIKSSLVLAPGQTYTVALEATAQVEIGWRAVQAKQCTTNCVQATEVRDGIKYSMATALGASQKYTPSSGRIEVEYTNVSTEPVTINIYRVERTCEAEACKFLDASQKGRWLVFKVGEFKSIVTSQDGSFSTISGVTNEGRPFTFKAVWWTEDKAALAVNCSAFVKRFLDNHTPKETYSPYVISGQAVGSPSDIILKSVDSCAPRADHYGVPDANVFR